MPYFDQVKKFCLFAASGRSGHSIIAHFLTAHPKVMICDELGAVSFFDEGYSKQQVFALIKYQDYRHQRRNRKKSGYIYKLDGLWQNISDKHPEVIGDAKGARTISLLGGDPDYLPKLRTVLDLPLRVIFHLRNPFDSLTTKIRKRNLPLNIVITGFKDLDRQITAAYEKLSDAEKLLQRHEDVIADPKTHFRKMFEFLNVDPITEVVNGCAAKIWPKPHKTRKKIRWPQKEVARLEEYMNQSLLFSSYL